MRNILFRLHLILGLTAGILLVVIGLSGSAIVFYKAIDEAIYPELFINEGGDKMLGAGLALEKAIRDNPDKEIVGILSPKHEKANYAVYHLYHDEAGKDQYATITLDAYTGETRGEYYFGETVMTWIYKLHYTLLGGDTGKKVVGFLGIALTLILFTGLYLWCPRNKSQWKRAFLWKPKLGGYKLHREYHRLLGFYVSPILLVLAISGIYMIFPQTFIGAVSSLLEVSPRLGSEISRESRLGEKYISPSRALEVATTVFPNSSLSYLDLPSDDNRVYMLLFASPDEPRVQGRGNAVLVDAVTSEILQIRRYHESGSGDKFLSWMFPLHNGEAFGLLGRLIVFASGFIPLIMFITGLKMWLIRRSKRMHSRTRAKCQN